jgi:predicted enzyme related to lactoylglutathione lyase
MSGEVVHFTIPADDSARARKFYATAFGWKVMEVPGSEYTMVSTGPVDERGEPKSAGYVGGGIQKRGGLVTHPVITITVDEIDDAEKLIVKHGGKLLQKKEPIGDGSMGWTSIFQDTEGNTVALYQGPKK